MNPCTRMTLCPASCAWAAPVNRVPARASDRVVFFRQWLLLYLITISVLSEFIILVIRTSRPTAEAVQLFALIRDSPPVRHGVDQDPAGKIRSLRPGRRRSECGHLAWRAAVGFAGGEAERRR